MQSRRIGGPAALIGVGLGLVGCVSAPKPIYYWGDYQPQLYGYFKGDDGGPQAELAKLEAIEQEAQGKGLPLPPGFHAHMGLLYLKAGQFGPAQASFLAEEAQFPESKPYMDFLLKKKAAVPPRPVATAPGKAKPAATTTIKTVTTVATPKAPTPAKAIPAGAPAPARPASAKTTSPAP